MSEPLCASFYQNNTRVWMTELAHNLDRTATLDDVPDAELDRIAKRGFDWVWFLSVWQTGLAGQRVSRTNPERRQEFQETLPDLREDDIPGSGFAITGYTVSQSLGGDAALARLRQRLRPRGLRLMLDFVPNHTGLDHPWVEEYKSYQARGYLQFLGNETKHGNLREEDLPLFGWPGKRIKNWRKKVWPCPWIGEVSQLVEPIFFLPSLLILAWLFVLLRQWLELGAGVVVVLSTILTVVMISLLCMMWVWRQQKDEE